MKVAAHHLESLDVFRGVTIAAMILVNNPGDWGAVFPQLMHAYWTGITFADVVFPWFVFIMGFALPFAFARRRELGRERRGRIARRVVLLIALGLVLNVVAAWPSAAVRIPGVLQRIGLAYLLASLVVLNFDVAGWVSVAALLLLGQWALLMLVPFGGFSAGTLTPEHNLARYLDTIVFGRYATTSTLDPEGLLGTFPCAATALIGAVVGYRVRTEATAGGRLRWLVVAGLSALVGGAAWSTLLPVSKPLWTGSYVLVVSGLAMLGLAATYALVDVLDHRAWSRPFLWLGVNPLAIYFLSEVTGHLLEDSWIPQGTGWTTPKAWFVWGRLEPAMRPLRAEWASLVFALAFVGTWIAVAGVLYRHRIRIQV